MIIPQDKWCKMSEDARKVHLRKFHQMSVIKDVLQEPCTSSTVLPSLSLPSLSVDFVFVASNCTLPEGLLQNIWDKASRLVNTKGAMAPAPGHPPEVRTVESTSKKGFYLVITGSSGRFTCNCANYQSLSLCSHAVAVAEINGRLEEFVEWHRKLKKSPSVTKLLVKDAYKGCGRKGGKAPPKKKKVEPIRERVELTPVVQSLTDTQSTSSVNNNNEMASSLHTTVPNHYYYDHPIANALGASHSQFLNPVPYAAPINPLPSSHSLLPSMSFAPWCNSSYISNNGIKWYNSLCPHLPLLIVCKSFLSSSLWGTLVYAMAAKIGTLRVLSLQMIFAYKQKNGGNLLLVVFSSKPVGQTHTITSM